MHTRYHRMHHTPPHTTRTTACNRYQCIQHTPLHTTATTAYSRHHCIQHTTAYNTDHRIQRIPLHTTQTTAYNAYHRIQHTPLRTSPITACNIYHCIQYTPPRTTATTADNTHQRMQHTLTHATHTNACNTHHNIQCMQQQPPVHIPWQNGATGARRNDPEYQGVQGAHQAWATRHTGIPQPPCGMAALRLTTGSQFDVASSTAASGQTQHVVTGLGQLLFQFWPCCSWKERRFGQLYGAWGKRACQ